MFSIYRFTNKVNGKVYIGKTIDPKTRLRDHLKSSNNSTLALHRAITKYGKENFTFEVIFVTFIESDLDHFERHFIKEYDCCLLDGRHKGYNMTRGGEGFDSETARNTVMKAIRDGKWRNPMEGKYKDPSVQEKWSKARKGKRTKNLEIMQAAARKPVTFRGKSYISYTEACNDTGLTYWLLKKELRATL